MNPAEEMLAGWLERGARLTDRAKRGNVLESVVREALEKHVVEYPYQISHRHRVDFEVEISGLVHGVDVKTSIKDRWRQPVLEQISMRRARGILSPAWESGLLLCVAPGGCEVSPAKAIQQAAALTDLARPFLGDSFVVLSVHDAQRVNAAFDQMRTGKVIRV